MAFGLHAFSHSVGCVAAPSGLHLSPFPASHRCLAGRYSCMHWLVPANDKTVTSTSHRAESS
eukprot:1159763-Amphidinium_carterae.1